MKRVNVRLWLFLMAVVFVFLWLSSAGLTYAGDGGVGDESLWLGRAGENPTAPLRVSLKT